ncbi:MAG: hypothetical protein OSB45_16050, partial [Pseudomonadales bacterium]|nr:hypothetical protein [Pseudomonadales bacterium]
IDVRASFLPEIYLSIYLSSSCRAAPPAAHRASCVPPSSRAYASAACMAAKVLAVKTFPAFSSYLQPGDWHSG